MKQSVTPSARDRTPLAAGALTVWVAVSPWVWGFADSHSAVANHVFLVLAFGPLALLVSVLRPAAVVTVLGGIWLAVSPWVLGYATDNAAWLNELVVGVLLSVLGVSAAGIGARSRTILRHARRRTPAGIDAIP
jgi:hypothetical protein